MLTTWSRVMLMCSPVCKATRADPPHAREKRLTGRARIAAPRRIPLRPARGPADCRPALNRGTVMRIVFLGVLAGACAASALATNGGSAKTAGTATMVDNPFAHPSALAFQLPPFDKIHDSDYLPAFQAGI